jgi:hypothetical protein
MIEIKTDDDAKTLVGKLVYYPGCGLLLVANAKLADGKLYIAPAAGFIFSRGDHPDRLRVIAAESVNVAPPPPPQRRDFSGLMPMRVTFPDGSAQVKWGADVKTSHVPADWSGLVVDLLTEYAKEHNCYFPKDTEVVVEIAGKLTTLRLENDVQ